MTRFWSSLVSAPRVEFGDAAAVTPVPARSMWYDPRRIQKELGYLSPDEYETTWHTQTEPDSLTHAPTGSR